MIQRIQSVWLLLAAITASALFYTDVYHARVMNGTAETIQALKVTKDLLSMLVAVVVVIIPLAAIFLFKNRKKQRNLIWLGFVTTLGLIAVINLWYINNFNSKNMPQPDGTYQVGSVLPVIVLFFLVLAIRGINKDEKLVRSLDRLR